MNRSLSAGNSFVWEHFDPVVKADRCAQYVDDIGIAIHTAEEYVDDKYVDDIGIASRTTEKNIELVFKHIELTSLKPSM